MKPIIKTCKHHGDLTEDMIYTWKYKNKTMRRCHQCILDKNKRAAEKWMQNPENVKKKRERDNKRYQENIDAIKAKRQSPEAKAKRRQWYKDHAPEYRAKFKAKQQKYRDNLEDPYVIRAIKNNNKVFTGVKFSKAMLDFKRTLLQAKRALRISTINRNKEDEV